MINPDFLARLGPRRDYRTDARAVETGHDTGTEQALYKAIELAAVAEHRRLGRPLRVLDVCSASGGCAAAIERAVPMAHLCLIDIEESMIAAARAKPWRAEETSFVVDDAVTWNGSGGRFDVVLMNSAYHHIEDERKQAFLARCASLLAVGGAILVGEHFLPGYDPSSDDSYRRAVEWFYSERLQYLQEIGTPEEGLEVIRQTAWYCWQRQYEYQVSQRVSLSHIVGAGLCVQESVRVWPLPDARTGLPSDSGTFYMVARVRA